jgi:signal transduction histidine kinase
VNEQPSILLLPADRDIPEESRAVLEERLPVQEETDSRSIPPAELNRAELIVLTQAAIEDDPSLARRLHASCGVPLLLLREREEEIPRGLEDFDDHASLRSLEELGDRTDLLLGFRRFWKRAEELGVTTDDLRGAFARYDLDSGLVGPFGLCPPGRVSLNNLVDVGAVNTQQMSICKLMGTAYGTFLHAGRPKGLPDANGEEAAPTGALSPYCAYLSAQGGRCLRSEYSVAREALRTGGAVESKCSGRILIYSVPVVLSFSGLSYPLYAASVAVGGVAGPQEIEEVAEDYGVNSEILSQMAEESRFWVLNQDKVEEIKGTITTLAETISREVSHKYATAYQLCRGLLTESEIRRSEALLAESHKKLSESNRQLLLKNEEIYNVTNAITHDLRKPLATLKATIGLMHGGRLGPVPETMGEAVDASHEATNYMQVLVDDLLEAARLDTGRKMLEMREMNLEPLVERVRKRFRILMEENGVDLVIGDLPPAVNADESAVEKVLMNLIGNSLSYIGDEEKKITVEGGSDSDYAILTVTDTGIGIPEDCLPEIFEKFRRGGNVAGIRGTGLGLAIVKGIVGAHGGTVTVESEVGVGTKVTITLPLARVVVV